MTRRVQFIYVPRAEWRPFVSSRIQHVRWWAVGPVQIVWHGKPWGEKEPS